jgi:ABC-type antimicrobial peptide transport system permease subunit
MMTRPASNRIQPQVQLPISVALEVVLQGIRIRLGRSFVTMMGVVLGVAFLMSVFSTNLLRTGLKEETDLRDGVQRMLNFLTAETGNLEGRTLGLVIPGDLTLEEQRLITGLADAGVVGFQVYPAASAGLIPKIQGVNPVEKIEGFGEGASGLLVFGGGGSEPDWAVASAGLRQPVLAYSRREFPAAAAAAGLVSVRLDRPLGEEEEARLAADARRERSRNIWIITIALLVTTIGITNSLLMSVTERFKEIGTMKCLGALSSFVRQMFFLESALTGLLGSVIGVLVGFFVAAVLYSFLYGPGLVFAAMNYAALAGFALISIACGLSMSILAAIYPASYASRMVPATALRSNI